MCGESSSIDSIEIGCSHDTFYAYSPQALRIAVRRFTLTLSLSLSRSLAGMVPNPLSTRLSHLRGRQMSAKGPVSRDTWSRHRKLQSIWKVWREKWCQINPDYLLHMESQNRDMHEIHIALGNLLLSFTSPKIFPKKNAASLNIEGLWPVPSSTRAHRSDRLDALQKSQPSVLDLSLLPVSLLAKGP